MTTTEAEHKMCTCCRKDRPVGRFLYSQFTVDGLTDRCLDCISAEAAANRAQRETRIHQPATKGKTKRKAGSKRHCHAAHLRQDAVAHVEHQH